MMMKIKRGVHAVQTCLGLRIYIEHGVIPLTQNTGLQILGIRQTITPRDICPIFTNNSTVHLTITHKIPITLTLILTQH